MSFIQKFNTSRQNYDNGSTRVGEEGRLWYDSISNTIRVSDGVTPGGVLVSGGGGAINFGTIDNVGTTGTTYSNISTLEFDSSTGFSLSDLGSGSLKVTLLGYSANTDGGLHNSTYGGINPIDGGGVV